MPLRTLGVMRLNLEVISLKIIAMKHTKLGLTYRQQFCFWSDVATHSYS